MPSKSCIKGIDKPANAFYTKLVLLYRMKCKFCAKQHGYPGVAQLVARLLWEQDAAGSNPVTRTSSETPLMARIPAYGEAS